MVTKKQVEALKKAEKEKIKEAVRKMLARKTLDRERFLLMERLKKANEMLYNLYKSGDIYLYVKHKDVPEKKLLKDLLEMSRFFKRMGYNPRESEAYGLVTLRYQAGLSLEDLEKAVKEIEERVKDPSEKEATKGIFLRKLLFAYKMTGYRGKDMVQYALEQTLRIRGEKTLEREEAAGRAFREAEKKASALGIEDPELERMMANMILKGSKVDVKRVAELLDSIRQMNPYYAEQAVQMVENLLTQSMASGAYTPETMREIEERLEEMKKEIEKRTKKKG